MITCRHITISGIVPGKFAVAGEVVVDGVVVGLVVAVVQDQNRQGIDEVGFVVVSTDDTGGQVVADGGVVV